MAETLSYDEIYYYDTLKKGITVPVYLKYGSQTVDLKAKIDTGAENCIFERKHAELLGIEVEHGELQSFIAATSSFLAYGHELTINVLEIEFISTVYFAKEESLTRNVLGRQGWLDRVKLGLIDYEGKLFFSEYNK